MKPSAPKLVNCDATLLCRISSEKQAEGYSLDFQERGGHKYAEQKALHITDVFPVTESAFKDGRVEWDAYLERAKHGPETHILIPKVDRSLRNPHDLAVVIDFPKKYPHKVLHFFDDHIIYDKDSPASVVLQLMMLGSMAVWYSYDLAQKTKRGLEEKALQGEWPNRAPRAYKNNKEVPGGLELVVELAPWITRIKELSATANYSLEAIVHILRKEGCPWPLHKSEMAYIIRNAVYAGYCEWPKNSGNLTKGKWQPIVSWELHKAAIAGLERFSRPHYNSHDFLFKGLIQCAECGCAVVFERKKGRYVYGHCTRRRPCTSTGNVREEELEQEVERILYRLSPGPEMSERILRYLEETAPQAATANVSQLAIKKQTVGRIKTALDNARSFLCNGTITEADYIKQKRESKEQLASLEEQIKKLEEEAPANIIPLARTTLELSNCCCQRYKLGTVAQKREILASVCSNFLLDGKRLAPQWRKPFQLVAEMASCSKVLRD